MIRVCFPGVKALAKQWQKSYIGYGGSIASSPSP
jgi:hypothetical protein